MDHYSQIVGLTKEVGSLNAKFESLSKSNKEINKKLDEALSQGNQFIKCQIDVHNRLWGDDRYKDSGEIPRLLLAQETHKQDIEKLQEKDKKQRYFYYGFLPAISIGIGKYGEHIVNYILKVLHS